MRIRWPRWPRWAHLVVVFALASIRMRSSDFRASSAGNATGSAQADDAALGAGVDEEFDKTTAIRAENITGKVESAISTININARCIRVADVVKNTRGISTRGKKYLLRRPPSRGAYGEVRARALQRASRFTQETASCRGLESGRGEALCLLEDHETRAPGDVTGRLSRENGGMWGAMRQGVLARRVKVQQAEG